jgi:hypothetical protein
MTKFGPGPDGPRAGRTRKGRTKRDDPGGTGERPPLSPFEGLSGRILAFRGMERHPTRSMDPPEQGGTMAHHRTNIELKNRKRNSRTQAPLAQFQSAVPGQITVVRDVPISAPRTVRTSVLFIVFFRARFGRIVPLENFLGGFEDDRF